MKTFIITLFMLCSAVAAQAQFDDKFYHPVKEWMPCQMPQFEDVYFYPEQDTLHAVFCKPEGTPVATILYLHGNYGNISFNASRLDTLVKAGFQVFIPDFRGYGRSSGTPTHQNIASDGQMIFDYLKKRPDVASTKLIVYGASIGTQLASKLAKDNQNAVQALILEGGMSSFTDMALRFIPEEQREYAKPYLIFPYSSEADIQAIGQMSKLIIHSSDDQIVPFEQGKTVYNAAKEPKKFLECKGQHLEALITEPGIVINNIKVLLH